MKGPLLFLVFALGLQAAAGDSTAHITVDAQQSAAPLPLIFTASGKADLQVSPTVIDGTTLIVVRVQQSGLEPKRVGDNALHLTLELLGNGDVTSVTGDGLKSWAVRNGASSHRYLDIVSSAIGAPGATDYAFTVRTRQTLPSLPAAVSLFLIGPGDAASFALRATIDAGPEVHWQVAGANGDIVDNHLLFHGSPSARLTLSRAAGDVRLTEATLNGQPEPGSASLRFRFQAQATADQAGARITLLSGRAAPLASAAGDGWHLEAGGGHRSPRYDLVFDRPGTFRVDVPIAAALSDVGGAKAVDLTLPAAAIVAVRLSGIDDQVAFEAAAAVPLVRNGAAWTGFLPADGHLVLRWRPAAGPGQGALAFRSSEVTDIIVGAGLVRQTSLLQFRVFQGSLAKLVFDVEGQGEIVDLSGAPVTSWQVKAAAEGHPRRLVATLSRPFTDTGSLLVRSQSLVTTLPARLAPLRLTPEGSLQYSGTVRLSGTRGIRPELLAGRGMLQLSGAQGDDSFREGGPTVAYRFFTADRTYEILAAAVVPETDVAEIATYELSAAGRNLQADLELAVRSAPLSQWSFRIPADYAVAELSGADVADNRVEDDAEPGYRRLTASFSHGVIGRTLLHLRLEQDATAARNRDRWTLPSLLFPGAASVRGEIALAASAGFRFNAPHTAQLEEEPIGYFARQTPGLQLAFRLRDPNWSAQVGIETLRASVQADVFHLYALKASAVSASVLINYFVAGAPATSWRIQVPASAQELEIVGEGVRRDWRRQGDQVIVTLDHPVMGAVPLLVTFEEPRAQAPAAFSPGEVRPLDVQAERGYLEVVAERQAQAMVQSQSGALLKVTPSELPAEYRALAAEPALVVYEYTSRPFSLNLTAETFTPALTANQVVDYGEFTSQLSPDGQGVTQALLYVKSRGTPWLRLTLPAGTALWECHVDGSPATPRSDGGAILIPLNPSPNPEAAAAVELRFGQSASGSGSRAVLHAPSFDALLALARWTVHTVPGRVVVPGAGSAGLVHRNLPLTGFESLSARVWPTLGALLLLAVGAAAARARPLGWLPTAATAGLLGLIVSGGLLLDAAAEPATIAGDPVFSVAAIPAGGAVTVSVQSTPPWQAFVSLPGLCLMALGLAAGIAARRLSRRAARVLAAAATVLVAAGLLAQRDAAPVFFVLLGAGLIVAVLIPAVQRARTVWRQHHRRAAAPSPVASAGAMLLVLGLVALPTRAIAAGGPLVHSLVQNWILGEGRLVGSVEFAVEGRAGDRFALLRAPAVLTGFSGQGLTAAADATGKVPQYVVTLDQAGLWHGRATFEESVPDLNRGVPMLTPLAPVQRVTVRLDQSGWTFASPAAVAVEPLSGLGTESGATLILGLGRDRTIRLRPRARDRAAEATRYTAETDMLYLPGAGSVSAVARLSVRPITGRVTALTAHIPEGFTVVDVSGGPVASWQFAPALRSLQMTLSLAATEPFVLQIQLQRGLGDLPYALSLSPLTVAGVESQYGLLAIAGAAGAQPEAITAVDAEKMGVEDFDASFVPPSIRGGEAPMPLAAVYRFDGAGAAVRLRVTPVLPDIGVQSDEVVSIGDDRVVVGADLAVTVKRMGVFSLSFPLPAGLEVESISGPFSDWTQRTEGGAQMVTMHFSSRFLGTGRFAVTWVGSPPPASLPWTVPEVTLNEARRQRGTLQVAPATGIGLRVLDRTRLIESEAEAPGPAAAGARFFRILEKNSHLAVAIEPLAPWITAQCLEEVAEREGERRTRVAIRYNVENAAVRELTLGLPGLAAAERQTVRATGAAVNDLVPVAGRPGFWKIRFQRRVLGDTLVVIEYEGIAGTTTGERQVVAPVLEGVAEVQQFVALRAGGQMEIAEGPIPAGWERVDWNAAPPALQNAAEREPPAEFYHAAFGDRTLAYVVCRHEAAAVPPLRAVRAHLQTELSARGSALTELEVTFEVAEKDPLQIRLPADSELFAVLVNDEPVAAVLVGGRREVLVVPGRQNDREAVVRMIYEQTEIGERLAQLVAPQLSVPLENLTWSVSLPPGYALVSHGGDLQWAGQAAGEDAAIARYESLMASARTAAAERVQSDFSIAGQLAQRGFQDQAAEILRRLANSGGLDPASDEDARVELHVLRTQQAMMGVNTRLQRIYLQNTAGTERSQDIQRAAAANPLLRGAQDFDPQQIDELMAGNGAAANAALRDIAARIVDQQSTGETPPQAIAPVIAAVGTVVSFNRAVQTDAAAPLELRLRIVPEGRRAWPRGLLVLAALGVIAYGYHCQTRSTG